MTVARLGTRSGERPVLVTGGCGFLGCNIVDALAARGGNVRVLDNLSRRGVRENAHWLKARYAGRVEIQTNDIRDADAVCAAVTGTSAVMHLAGQVAVTTSLERPVEDFDVNLRGTLNVLEAVRRHNAQAPLVFASTNKVYGRLFEDNAVRRADQRCVPFAALFAPGIGEEAPLDFHSPYGCSKGGADQYVRDYARVFGLRTVVMRMSCIYGPRQFGTEDQGWIAHFLIQAIRGKPITIYGDGYQVRDALFVDDAVNAWIAAVERIDGAAGRAFNLGGGPANSVSLRELLALITDLIGTRPEVRFDAPRPGDQPWYVSDTRAISCALDWSARTPLREGLGRLTEWLEHRFSQFADRFELEEARA
jgi:CDP-paratose 2-epimerase